MAERTEKIIFETEYKVTGTELTTEKLDQLVTASNKVTKSNLEKVAADKKVEQAANQLNKSIDTQTQKQTALSQSIEKTGKAMSQIASTNTLKEAFTGTAKEIDVVSASLKKFEQAAKAANSVEELTAAVNELMAALPEDVRADAFKMIEKETAKLANTIDKPVARLRELKRLINTADDPELLKQYQIEAGKLQDKLGDTNELVRALASDTFFSDTLVEGAQTAVGAFSAFQGVLALTTEDQEEFAKAAAKAQGALALLQGTQQILSNLKKEDNIITRAQILAQKGYALVVGQSTGAMKGFKLALAATGIGLAVVALIALVQNFDKVKFALGFGVNPETEKYIELTGKAVEAAEKETRAFENQAASLRLVADRKALLNEDSVQAQIERANAEIEIITQETQNISDELKTREADLEAHNNKLKELQQKRKEQEKQSQADRSGGSAVINRLFGISDEDIQEEQKKVDEITDVIQKGVVKIQGFENTRLEQKAKITELLKNEDKKQADDRLKSLAEQERHALAIAGIEKKTEAEILAIRIDFAQRRLDLTQKLGTADRTDITRLKNEIIELKLELANLKPKDIELFTPGSISALEAQLSAINKLINDFGESDQTANLVRQRDQIEKDLQDLKDRIFGVQQELNFELLDEEQRHELAMLSINESTNLARINAEIRFAEEKLRILKEAGKGEEIEAIRLANTITELEAEAARERADIRKQELFNRIDNVKSALTIATDLSNQLLQLEINRYTEVTKLQQQRVKDAEELAERGNVALLELEQKRLDEITKKREKFVRRQQVLAQLELIANTIVTVSKAAAEGGGIASAFTIAAALAALAIGLTAGVSAARSTDFGSFKKGGVFDPERGGYTGDGPVDGVSLAVGKKPYEYHYREHIMPASVAGIGDNIGWLEKIRMNRIDIGEMMKRKNSQPIVVAAGPQEIDARPIVNFNLNSKGIISINEKHERNKQRLKSKK